MQLIYRTLDTLTALSKEKTGLSVSQLSGILSIPASSVHRILSCLKKDGFVVQDEYSKRYQIGYKILSLCADITEHSSIINIARPHMDRLEKSIEKTIVLYVLEEKGAVCIDYSESRDISILYLKKGQPINPYGAATGKIILANLDKSALERVLDTVPMVPTTPKTITNRQTLYHQLEKIKDQGYAICDEELYIGVKAFACAIFDHNNRPVAAITFATLAVSDPPPESQINALKECAKNISRALGQNI